MNEIEIKLTSMADSFIEKAIHIDANRAVMPSGHNGPYFDLETSIRSTAHWLCTYSILYKKTNKDSYGNLASKLANFLKSPGANFKTINNIYVHRQKQGKDWCNGVIGQAWVIEALNIASCIFNRSDLNESALTAARSFPFSRKHKAWVRLDPGGKIASIDYTLNHQIWYAAALVELRDDELDEQVDVFLDGLADNAYRVRSDGQICHVMKMNSLKGRYMSARYLLSQIRNKDSMFNKEAGYHLFNLYALARIYRFKSSHGFFESNSFKESIRALEDADFVGRVSQSTYSYPYNNPAFEWPLVQKTFQLKKNNKIMEGVCDYIVAGAGDDYLFGTGVYDPVTMYSRIYEYFLGECQ